MSCRAVQLRESDEQKLLDFFLFWFLRDETGFATAFSGWYEPAISTDRLLFFWFRATRIDGLCFSCR